MAKTRMQLASIALRNLLAGTSGVAAFVAVRAVCQAVPCFRGDVHRAAEELGVVVETLRNGSAGVVVWRLPTEPSEQRWTN